MKTFGIIGGYGSNASLAFQEMLFKAALKAGAQEDEDFPQYVLAHTPQKVISSDGITVNEQTWEYALKSLNSFIGATHEAILLCNSLHYNERLIQNTLTPNLVSIVDLTEQAAAPYKKRLILASAFSKEHSVYGEESEYNHYYDAEEAIQKVVTNQIRFADHIRPALDYAAAHKFDVIILGCTELTLYADTVNLISNIPYVDSVEEAVKYIMKGVK